MAGFREDSDRAKQNDRAETKPFTCFRRIFMQTVIKDLSLNKEMDSKDMTATEGGFTLPSTLNVPVVKLIAPPVPVTQPNQPTGGVVSGGDPGSGGGGGGGFYLDGFEGSGDHRPD
jgi:hypothetical protein